MTHQHSGSSNPGPTAVVVGLDVGGTKTNATVLDEAMVWAAIWNCRRACVAGELTVRFRRPGRVGETLTCTATVTAARSRMIEVAGTITNRTGDVVATATGKYVPLADAATLEFFQTLVADPSTDRATSILTAAR